MRDVCLTRGATAGQRWPWRRYASLGWLVLVACHAAPDNAGRATLSRTTPMQTQQLTLRVQEPHEVTLPIRGASGLQLLFSAEPAEVVSVTRRDISPAERGQLPPVVGGATPAIFVLTGLKPGQATIYFFEKPAPGRGGPAEIPVATYRVTVSQ